MCKLFTLRTIQIPTSPRFIKRARYTEQQSAVILRQVNSNRPINPCELQKIRLGRRVTTNFGAMDWWTISTTLAVGGLCVYLFFTRNFNYFEKLGVPYVKPIPMFGNMAEIIFRRKTFPDVIQDVYRCHPDAKYVGFFDFSTPIILLKDPELVKLVTIKHFDSFPNHKMFAESSPEPLFQKNLFALKDDAWRDMRALLSPAFTSSKMKLMFKMLSQCAVDFAEHLAKLDPRPDEFDMKDTFGKYTLDVIASAAFGLSVNSMKDPNNEFYRLGKSISDFSGLKVIMFFLARSFPWLAKFSKLRFVDEKTADFFTNVIKSTIATRDAEGIVRPDMIQLMMQARERREKFSLSSEDMTAQAFIFLIGGFDSPSTTMSFAAYALAFHPDVQSKLQAEIDEVLENSSGQVTYEDLHAMKYLDAVVNETLRMFPPGAFMDRVGPKSYTLPPALPGLEPLTINPGQSIWIPLYSFHYDPQYFEDPEKFDPERFSEENKAKINPVTYTPFGIGPRICIANRFALMEVKLVLFHLLSKCNLLPTPKTKYPMKLKTGTLTMIPDGGFWLKIEPRKSNHVP